MEEKVYTFDPSNHRLVTNCQRSDWVNYGAGALYLLSLYAYRRRIHRIDGKTANFAAFAVASAWASY